MVPRFAQRAWLLQERMQDLHFSMDASEWCQATTVTLKAHIAKRCTAGGWGQPSREKLSPSGLGLGESGGRSWAEGGFRH